MLIFGKVLIFDSELPLDNRYFSTVLEHCFEGARATLRGQTVCFVNCKRILQQVRVVLYRVPDPKGGGPS